MRSSDMRAISDDSPSAAAETACSTVESWSATPATPELWSWRVLLICCSLPSFIDLIRWLEFVSSASTAVVSTDDAFSDVM